MGSYHLLGKTGNPILKINGSAILFGKLQEIWVVICSDAIFLSSCGYIYVYCLISYSEGLGTSL